MVMIELDCAVETAAYGLRFMYTHREFLAFAIKKRVRAAS